MTQLPSRPSTPSIEAQVVRLGLLTPDQVATAMREEAETGRTFDEIVVGHGWMSADELARVREPAGAPAPTPVAAPEPPAAPVAAAPAPPPVAVVPDPEPEPDPVPEVVAAPAVAAVPEPIVEETPAPVFAPAAAPTPVLEAPVSPAPAAERATSAHAHVFVRLASGERIDAGSFESEDTAERRARELMRLLDAGGDWPQLDGRYIRPDAIVSIDVDASA